MPLEIGRHAQNVLVLDWRSATDAQAAAAGHGGGCSDGARSGTDGHGSRSNCRRRVVVLLQRRVVVKVVMLLPYTYCGKREGKENDISAGSSSITLFS